MAIDISIALDPVADVLDALIVIILLWYVKFDKKQARKKPRKPKIIMPEHKGDSPVVVVTNP